ncbi:hypothetical protein NCS56_01500500 [Fusarium sp. Ph1]|nr:hypothetical protein NCS56_01500500 [Fusarium sp. Ph1]
MHIPVTPDKLVLAIHCQATGNSGGGKGLAGVGFILVCRLRARDWLVWVPLSRPVGSAFYCESYLGRWESHQRLLLRMSFVLALLWMQYSVGALVWIRSANTTFFRLRVPIQLKIVPNVTTLLLHITPETIAELTVECPNELHQALLSQATSLDVYFRDGILQDATARTVCGLAASPMARSIAQYADLDALYAGKGGVVLAAESPPSPPTTFPPSYNELCVTTPPPPLQKDHPSPAHSSRKRPRKSSFDPLDVESICARLVKDSFALYEKDF